jgi:uncharacterized membrane protein (Fun14 family)
MVCSVLLMAAGLALPLALAPRDTGGDNTAAVVDPSLLAPGFAATEGPAGAPSESPVPAGEGTTADGLRDWSPTIFRLGFSFFVGFAIGYAVRTFVKVSVLAIGAMLLLLFGLQYAGIIEVRWTVMEGHYDSIVAWLQGQTASFGDFITGYLPSTASAAFGLVVGFRKR